MTHDIRMFNLMCVHLNRHSFDLKWCAFSTFIILMFKWLLLIFIFVMYKSHPLSLSQKTAAWLFWLVSHFEFQRRMKVTWDWNQMRVSKWLLNINLGVNYFFECLGQFIWKVIVLDLSLRKRCGSSCRFCLITQISSCWKDRDIRLPPDPLQFNDKTTGLPHPSDLLVYYYSVY